MQNPPSDEFEEKRPEDENTSESLRRVGVYPVPEAGSVDHAGPEEPVVIDNEWTPEETTESPEALYSAPEPGTGETPTPASQESTYGGPYSGAQPQTPSSQSPYAAAPYGQVQKKDKSLSIILEILPAFFGIMGIGWIYGGNTSAGIGWLVGFLIWNAVALFLDAITFGVFLCVHIPVNIGLIALSAILLNNYTKQHPEVFN